jgi:signal transduction histidine kinase
MASQVSRAQDDERHRIARGIHDDLGQLLATAQIRIHQLRSDAGEGQLPIIDDLKRLVDEAIESSRTLAFEMITPMLNAGIDVSLADLTERLTQRHGVACGFSSDDAPKPLSPESGAALFRVVRELLANVARHAGATEAHVRIERTEDQITVVVQDDGAGFVPADPGSPELSGVGLVIVHERMAEIGGAVAIMTRPGEGTRVVVTAPLDPVVTRGGAP